MVILLEPTQNAAMRQADPYASADTVWYHVTWSALGAIQVASPIRVRPKRTRPERIHAGRMSGERVPVSVANTYCDPSHRDQPARRSPRPVDSVVIPPGMRPVMACAICDACARRRLAIRCLSISCNHVHALMKLDDDLETALSVIEYCKRVSSRLCDYTGRGGIWSLDSHIVRIRSELQFDRVISKICDRHEQDTYVWKHPRLREEQSVEKQWPDVASDQDR